MGQAACCAPPKDDAAAADASMLKQDEATAVADDAGAMAAPAAIAAGCELAPSTKTVEELNFDDSFEITLDKAGGSKLGLDVDVAAGSAALPIRAITGGLAEAWNAANPDKVVAKGDSIISVNGASGDVTAMLENCKNDAELLMKVQRAPTVAGVVADLEKLARVRGCGPILVRLSWHDAGVYCTGKGGCANAVMRLPESSEAKFDANAGLDIAISLLAPIAAKYTAGNFISNADLWALAANTAIKVMGGPDIPTRFGRADGASDAGVDSAAGRLPDGDKGLDHLREIFHPKGFDDQAIVALSGAHTLGRCHPERSGFDGPWTVDPLQFDNTYFTDLLQKQFKPETSSAGKPQHRCEASGTMMLISDLALLNDDSFKKHVERYAADQQAFFADFKDAWVKLQENGCAGLREAP